MPMKPSQPISSGTEKESKPPLYQQIYLQIRERITNGDYPDGSLLPTESEAALLFGVSRITVKRAFNELAADGLCVRKRGQGSRVTYKMSATPLKSDFQGLLDVFADMNMNDTEGKVLEFEYIAAGARIAELFNIDPSTQMQRSVRVLSHERKALSYLTTYVPADLGRQYESLHLVDQPVVTMLEKTGVKVAKAEQSISATLAESVTAKALQIKQGSPLLRIRRVVSDQDGRVVEYIVGLYRPDRFQYCMSLSRTNDAVHPRWQVD